MSAMGSKCLQCRGTMVLDPEVPPGSEQHCPHCHTRQVQQLYFTPSIAAATPATVADESGARCFFHDTAAASEVCEGCGRYVCTLCCFPDIEAVDAADPPALCPVCFGNRTEDGAAGSGRLRARYARYDISVLFLVLLPVVFFPLFFFVIVTAPMALYLAIRHGATQLSPVPRSKALLVLGALAAALELTIWSLLFLAIVVGALA